MFKIYKINSSQFDVLKQLKNWNKMNKSYTDIYKNKNFKKWLKLNKITKTLTFENITTVCRYLNNSLYIYKMCVN